MSSVAVDFIKLSFEDSASRRAQALLSEGEMTSEQAYELEYDIVHRPVFSWTSEQVSIAPGGRTTISVDCLGKVGCTDGLIRINCGSFKRDSGSDEVPKVFHTRQITFPVLFTVYHTLEPHSLDLVRIVASGDGKEKTGSSTPNSKSSDERIMGETPKKDMKDEHCLLGLSVRNSYGVPFEVSLRLSEKVSTSRLVPPGATER